MSDEYFGSSNEENVNTQVNAQENEANTFAAPETNVSPASESVLASSNNNALPEESLQNVANNAPQPSFPVNENNNNNNNNGNNANYANNINQQTSPYAPYNPNNYYQEPAYKEEPLSVGEWALTLILMCIPVVGLIMVIVWACGAGKNVSRRNFARANLIIRIVACVLAVFFTVVCYLTVVALGYRFVLPF